MKPIVIAFTGEAHSGKDTSADYLVEYFKSLGSSAIKVCLADQLKLICQKLIKLFYGIEIPKEEFYDLSEKERVRSDYPLFAGQPFKLRTVLQQVGTEIFRDLLWESVWCDYIKKTKIMNCQYQFIIISDCRFLDEIKYFSKLIENHENLLSNKIIDSFITCRIIRENKLKLAMENHKHKSESDILNLPVDVEINNNDTFDQLYQNLNEKIITKLNPYFEHN